MSTSTSGAIVIPVDFSRRSTQLLSRTITLASMLQAAPFEVLVAHNDRGSVHDKVLQLWASRFGNDRLRLVSGEFTAHAGHQSLLRNRAMAQVTSDVALFLDVDIYPDVLLFAELIRQVRAGAKIAMAPCLYLTREGTRTIRKTGDVAALLQDYLGFDRKRILHMAAPSSVMALKVSDYHRVGGFDERYYGHGYEDFDFMARFAYHFDLVTPCFDVFTDKAYRSPLLAQGFRANLAQLALPNLLDGRVAVHLFHPNDIEGAYRERRKENAVLFRAVLASLYGKAARLPPIPGRLKMAARFERECRLRALDPKQFDVLLENRAGHVDRGFSLRRQARKIMKWAGQ